MSAPSSQELWDCTSSLAIGERNQMVQYQYINGRKDLAGAVIQDGSKEYMFNAVCALSTEKGVFFFFFLTVETSIIMVLLRHLTMLMSNHTCSLLAR